jgi:hypothetical protein
LPELLPFFRETYSLLDDPDNVRGSDRQPMARGRRPVIFDIVAQDQETSLLPDAIKLVLHVNPQSMQFAYQKATVRTQTRGGFVEFHWGDAAEEISFDAATGGFMRLFTGLSNITGSGGGSQGRRETIAYDRYLDLLALFHNNGQIYDSRGNIVVSGFIKMSFDGGVHIGWFDGDFTVTEDANKPYQFNMSTRFIIDREIMRFRFAPGGPEPVPETVSQITEEPQPDTATTILNDPVIGSGLGVQESLDASEAEDILFNLTGGNL